MAIDLAVTSGEEADETGIVVAGKDKNGHGYVLADISGRYLPIEWARWRSPPTQLRLKGRLPARRFALRSGNEGSSSVSRRIRRLAIAKTCAICRAASRAFLPVPRELVHDRSPAASGARSGPLY